MSYPIGHTMSYTPNLYLNSRFNHVGLQCNLYLNSRFNGGSNKSNKSNKPNKPNKYYHVFNQTIV